MGKIINLSSVLEKEENLQQVVDYMEMCIRDRGCILCSLISICSKF